MRKRVDDRLVEIDDNLQVGTIDQNGNWLEGIGRLEKFEKYWIVYRAPTDGIGNDGVTIADTQKEAIGWLLKK